MRKFHYNNAMIMTKVMMMITNNSKNINNKKNACYSNDDDVILHALGLMTMVQDVGISSIWVWKRKMAGQLTTASSSSCLFLFSMSARFQVGQFGGISW